MSKDDDDGKVDWFGLRVTPESLDELRAKLDQITEMERRAWRNAHRPIF